MRKKLWLILVLAVFVALMIAPTSGLAQQHDYDRGRGPGCHHKCDRNYHCEDRCGETRDHHNKKCFKKCEKEKQHCEKNCEKQGYHR